MSNGHVLCALLPLLLALPDVPIAPRDARTHTASLAPSQDNRLESLCRALVTRIGEEVHAGVLLVDWAAPALIVDDDD